MACSLPVFITPAGLVSFDHVTPGEDILICDESELVAKVNESLFDADLMGLVGKNARCTVETHYSTAAKSEKFIKVIERLSTDRNAPAVRYSTQPTTLLGDGRVQQRFSMSETFFLLRRLQKNPNEVVIAFGG